MRKLEKLEDMPMWNEANGIAEYMYGVLPEFSREEEWHTRAKLHNVTADFILWAGLALGNVGPAGREFDWAGLRKQTAALKTIYRFACRQKFIKLDSEIMVRLNRLMEQIDTKVMQAYKQTVEYHQRESKKDLKPWLDKYEIWKKLGEEPHE